MNYNNWYIFFIYEIESLELGLMFRLMDKVDDDVSAMIKDLEAHIIDQGLADMIASAEIITQDSEKYVEQLLNLFERFSLLVKEAFNNDPRLLTARDKVILRLNYYLHLCLNVYLFLQAFKHVINDTSIFKLEFTAKYKWYDNLKLAVHNFLIF